MKKVFAILLAGLMLAASAAAEELYTFAGVGWDTPRSQCEAALEEGTGVGFEKYENEVFHDDDPAFLVEDGYYNVLGIRIETDRYRGIHAYYVKTEAYENGEAEWADDAAWALSEIRINGMDMPWDGGQNILDVWKKLQEHCGEPSGVYFLLNDYTWSGTTYYPYSVPKEEWPCILDDGWLFAQAEGKTDFDVTVHFGNVELWITAYENDDHALCYCMDLTYYAAPVTTWEEGGYEVEPFPMLEGDYVFTVIEPW